MRQAGARIRRQPPRRHVAHARCARPALPAVGEGAVRTRRLEGREKFERIFGKAVETDSALHDSDQVLQLLELLAESAGKPVRQVPFHVNLLPSYDTASPGEIEEAVHSFLKGTAALHARAPVGLHHQSPAAGHGARHVSEATLAGMTATPSSVLDRARKIAPELPFALLAPRYRFATGEVPDRVRHYSIHAGNGRSYPAYVIVTDRGGLGEYYDVEGTSWTHAPVLSNPTTTFHLGSRTYGLFYDGEHIKTVAWREGHAAYWVENTLTNGLTPHQMVAVAQETVPVISGTGAAPGSRPALSGFVVPGRSTSAASLDEKLGAGAAFLVLVALAGLSILLLRRQRELARLREQVGQAMALEASGRAMLGAAGGPEAGTPAPGPPSG